MLITLKIAMWDKEAEGNVSDIIVMHVDCEMLASGLTLAAIVNAIAHVKKLLAQAAAAAARTVAYASVRLTDNLRAAQLCIGCGEAGWPTQQLQSSRE